MRLSRQAARLSTGAARLPVPAALLAGCTAALLLQPASAASAALPPSGAERHVFPGGGTTTSLPLTSGHGLAPSTTRPYELLGVGWDGPAGALNGGSVRVRTRDAATGRWSDWHTLEADAEDGPDDAPHGATAPLWTGRSDGVAVDVRPGPAGLPPGLRVDLVDPGAGAPAAAAPRTLPAAPADGDHRAPRPGIVTRAGWGADESLREPGFEYTGPVREVFVHHTATATDYACSDAPRVIRSIYQYHVKTSGWRDIGYNFLVDRCGTIYEGRAGGVAQPVHGAHTLGFNTDSSGVAAIGTFVNDTPPQTLLDGITAISAWKLGLTGQAADGHTKLTSGSDASRYPKGTVVEFDAISGHRDAFNTECPGEALYARLPALRTAAAKLQAK
ncbi:peptidoglycan recognition protein [Kitasatospora aureofaciens]|uniref:peptidoglycan recognition protein family protein n=1 Tax=Kitasatospora aureofaciens TaxID=1894 RepID=UPI001D4D86F9|nr:peptidoglycan recognition protein [Kitasatospora aureofaciens]HJD85779.1 peptidoglycan recognition protein [Kitasatospora aureofaciens]